MSKEIIKDELVHLLDTIVEQTQTVCNYQNKVPQIEIDILMMNVRSFYEQLVYMQKQSNQALPAAKVNPVPVSLSASAQLKPNDSLNEQLHHIEAAIQPQVQVAENDFKPKSIETATTNTQTTGDKVVVQTPVAPVINKPEVLANNAALPVVITPETKPAQPAIAAQAVKPNVQSDFQPSVGERTVLQKPELTDVIVAVKPETKPESLSPKIENEKVSIAFEIPAVQNVAPIVASTIQFDERKNVAQPIQPQKNVESAELKTKKAVKTTASLFDAPPNIASVFDDTTTLATKLETQQTTTSIADKLNSRKIADLKKAIGINEKFLFINELFEGSLASYNEHIEKINVAADVHHAHAIIDALISKYAWDGSLSIVKQFKDLVDRRFL
ncbi:MAG: hypothetical protein JNK61_08900 [Bacteroidia bacterium]|nr:hypothetical protein [Bacteroidia bacterium]HQU99775.1 hypothetical protein [Bacteroidia bacterium]